MERRATREEIDQIAWTTIKTAKIHAALLTGTLTAGGRRTTRNWAR